MISKVSLKDLEFSARFDQIMKSFNFGKTVQIDVCHTPTPVQFSRPYFFYGICFNHAFAFFEYFFSSHRSIAASRVICIQCTYASFALTVLFLKFILSDYNCSRIPNSVSGHTFFNVFHFLAWLSLVMNSHRTRTIFEKFMFLITQSLNIGNVYGTFIGGYHTPRQMLYGGLCAIIVFLFMRLFYRKLNSFKFIFLFINSLIWYSICQFVLNIHVSKMYIIPLVSSFGFALITHFIYKERLYHLSSKKTTN